MTKRLISSPYARRLRLHSIVASFILAATLATFYVLSPPPVQGGGSASVVVNKYQNSNPATPVNDIVELLVIQNNLDMRGMIIKDFSGSMANDGGGKLQFSTDALWSSVRAGTLIVLRTNNSAADTSVGGADYNLDIGLLNTTYFSNLGGTFDIAAVEMVMIKEAGSGAAGVTGSIHALAGGAAGAQFTAAPNPKLRASTGSSGGQFVFANNSTQSIADYDGIDATGGATGLTFGAGNNANNTAYINSLRNVGGPPSLSINNVSVTEGNSGTVLATFTVSLSSAAGVGGVTFDIATQDNSATVADNDYVAQSLTSQTIAEGGQMYSFNVTVNGDTTSEPDEKFFVNVTIISGATLGDGQGEGTITNDDINAIPIHTIQGSGSASPFVGSVVTTTGIVTGRRTNGFFIQTPDANVDGNTATSEGVFVFTSTAPPASAAIGNSVAVTGTVVEFIPSVDPFSPPLTEIGGTPTVTQFSTGNPLPVPITLTAADTSPTGSIEQLEKFEGMRVFVASLTSTSPTDGFTNEANATGSSDGTFFAVITGIARPFREPGVEVPDPLPAGSPCCVPRFDANPERLRVDSDALGAAAINVTTGATITSVTGVLDYSFRTYTILPDAGSAPGVSGLISAIPVPIPAADEFTVGSFNMERFYNTVDDPGGDVVLTATAYNNRLNKASLAIRNVMRTPDIIGVEEMENLATLQDLANKINNDAVAAGDPNPMYSAHLFEGNDVGGIDVGFLVKGSRVTVLTVVQEGKTTTYTEPGGGSALLNDRPPLVLTANITAPCGGTFPITVIVNHLRSLNGIDDPADGDRVRTKRRAQAEFLANLIQTRLTANPNERIISVGDYNAFQFSDGYVDLIGTIKGTPTPADQVVLASSDLVNPDLIELIDQLPPDQRYSFSFDGNAQTLDHEIVTPSLFTYFSRISYARSNGDFPEIYRSDPNRPERLSDHDMPVSYFKFTALSKKTDFFPSSGGTGTVNVTAPAGCNWTAASNDDWIIIVSSPGGNGNGGISYELRENFTGSPRTGTLTVAGHTLTVIQDGDVSGDCIYTLSRQFESFAAAGGIGSFDVITEERCAWAATSNVSWITITSGQAGIATGTVSYSVAANPGTGGRKGTITVAGKTFSVKQKGQ